MLPTESDPDGDLTEMQQAVLTALLDKPTIKAAAKAAKCSTVTVHKYLNDPFFMRVYRRARSQVLDTAITSLGRNAAAAVGALKRNLTYKDRNIQVRAATVILDKALAGQPLSDLQAEIDELRALLAEAKQKERRNEGTPDSSEPPKPDSGPEPDGPTPRVGGEADPEAV